MRTKRSLPMLTLTSLCAVFLCSPGAIYGRTLYVDDDAAGPQDGSTWTAAFRRLQDALTRASAGDEIRVAQGAYLPDQGGGNTAGDHNATFGVPDGVTIKGGFAGVGAADPDLRDVALFPTILTGDLAGNDDPNDQSTLSDNSFPVVTADGVSNDTVLDGLTIAHGNAADGAGGGLRNMGASPIVRDCTFFRNRAYDGGGGVMNTGSHAVFVGCTFLENWSSDGDGGGMYNHDSHIRIENCRFIRNRSDEGGSGLYNAEGSSEVINCVFRANTGSDRSGAILSSGEIRLLYCTFADNRAQEDAGAVSCTGGKATIAHCLFHSNAGEDGGAIYLDGGASVSLSQCTLYGNSATEHAAGVHCRGAFRWADQYVPAASLHASGCIFWANRALNYDGTDRTTGYEAQIDGDPSQITIEYCCIEGWTPEYGGMGNIGDDPLFVAPDQDDFHLKSQAGHWDAVLQVWVPDDVTSPCIDAGDPLIAVEHELFPNGGIVNMGVYGGTCEASKSWFGTEPCPTVNAADINGDCRVDAEDYRLIVLRWLQPAIGP